MTLRIDPRETDRLARELFTLIGATTTDTEAVNIAADAHWGYPGMSRADAIRHFRFFRTEATLTHESTANILRSTDGGKALGLNTPEGRNAWLQERIRWSQCLRIITDERWRPNGNHPGPWTFHVTNGTVHVSDPCHDQPADPPANAHPCVTVTPDQARIPAPPGMDDDGEDDIPVPYETIYGVHVPALDGEWAVNITWTEDEWSTHNGTAYLHPSEPGYVTATHPDCPTDPEWFPVGEIDVDSGVTLIGDAHTHHAHMNRLGPMSWRVYLDEPVEGMPDRCGGRGVFTETDGHAVSVGVRDGYYRVDAAWDATRTHAVGVRVRVAGPVEP